ncbi:MAG: DUF3667 domain-containing protein [Alphaproteobacteria bacterium]|nr:DUF3667 domain-containing protein [Alphaproteobacteria bacterium]
MTDGLDEAAQTAAEHAAATAAEPGRGAKARASRPAALAPDAPDGVCANCFTHLQGPVCHNCGQLADEYHRPARGLLGELVEGLFALDGRVARTIPNLLGRPGRITRDYLKGRRARYMPPFRLYIIASLIFFLLVPGLDQASDGFSETAAGVSQAMSEAGPTRAALRERMEAELQASVDAGDMTEEEAAQALESLARMGVIASGENQASDELASQAAPPGQSEAAGADAGEAQPAGPAQGAEVSGADSSSHVQFIAGRSDGQSGSVVIGPGGEPDQIRRFFAPEDYGESPPDSIFPLSVRRFLGDRFAGVSEDPGGWVEATLDWVPRIMFVMVPIYALLLSLVYAWRRRFFFYDHLIVSMHFHSALFLAMGAGLLIGSGWAFLALLVYSNIYLYRLNRVVYERGRIASGLRTLTLDFLYLIVLLFGFLAVLLLGALAG